MRKGGDVTYEEWLAQVPESLKRDPIWRFDAYPKAVFLFDLAWEDCEQLMRDLRGREVARQLIRSAGSISNNIDEGFGRGVEGGTHSFCAMRSVLHEKLVARTIKGASSWPQKWSSTEWPCAVK